MARAEAHRRIDHQDDPFTRDGDIPGRRDGDAADADRSQVGLAPSRPVLVRHVDPPQRQAFIGDVRREGAGGRVAAIVRSKEHEPAVAGIVFLDGKRLELVERGMEQLVERRIGDLREVQIERRVASQRCL